MATYKVLQDIEAEDKLVGPLTLRQFIYAGICAVCMYLTFLVVTKGAGFAAVLFFPVGVVAGFFAWPWSRDQPTEIWALAKIRFLVKARKRIWDQSGVKELVTITAPKKVERVYTNGLSINEVNSRLKVLADTIDSRGWAIKNVNVNMYNQRGALMQREQSDRLISLDNLPQDVPSFEVQASDDILDEQNNPLAAQVESKLQASTKAHREQIMERLKSDLPKEAPKAPAAPSSNNYWFLNQPSAAASSVPQNAVTFNTQVVAPGGSVSGIPAATAATPTDDDVALLQQIKAQDQAHPNTYSHLHNIQPLTTRSGQPVAPAANPVAPATPAQPVTATPKPDILDLANNDDLNVATLAREAHKRRELPPDEVVISLH